MIRRPPRSTQSRSSAASDVYKRQDHMKRAAASALEAAQQSRPDKEWPALPSPDVVGRAEGCWRYDDATAIATPEERARHVIRLLNAAEADNTAGVFETSAHSFSVRPPAEWIARTHTPVA